MKKCMAACPYCYMESGWTRNTAYCTAKSNPGNESQAKQKGSGNYYSSVGVAYAKCFNEKAVGGLTIKDCPFYKKG